MIIDNFTLGAIIIVVAVIAFIVGTRTGNSKSTEE